MASSTIETVRARPLRTDPSTFGIRFLAGPKSTVTGPLEPYTYCLVEVSDSDGTTGFGEAYCRGSPEAHAAVIEKSLAPLIVNSDPLANASVVDRLLGQLELTGGGRGIALSALSAVDIALWDLKAKVLGVPVYRLLGAPERPSIESYYSCVQLTEPTGQARNDLFESLRTAIDEGFRKFKLELRRDLSWPALTGAIEVAMRVRQELGEDCELMIDAQGSLSLDRARRIIGRVDRLELAWFEDPLRSSNVSGYRNLNKVTSTPIAVGEYLGSAMDYLPFFERDLAAVVQPDVGRCGGISEALRLAAIARLHGVRITPHIGWAGPVARLAAAHMMASLPRWSLEAFEYVRDSELVQPYVDLSRCKEMRPDSGQINLGVGLGLGIGIVAGGT